MYTEGFKNFKSYQFWGVVGVLGQKQIDKYKWCKAIVITAFITCPFKWLLGTELGRRP